MNDKNYTSCLGTITGITMNGASKGTSGIVDLGTVLTAHQSLANYYTMADTSSSNEICIALSSKQDKLSDVQISAIDDVVDEYITTVKYMNGRELKSSIAGELTKTHVQEWESHVFSAIKEVKLGSSITSIGNNALEQQYMLDKITLPDSISQIGSNAFYYCNSISSIAIPECINAINAGTFYECASLRNVSIPGNVTRIGDQAFEDCKMLSSVIIGEHVSNIGASAFKNCIKLSTIVIPSSVNIVGSNAFSNCSSLTSVVVEGKTYSEAETMLSSASLPSGC